MSSLVVHATKEIATLGGKCIELNLQLFAEKFIYGLNMYKGTSSIGKAIEMLKDKKKIYAIGSVEDRIVRTEFIKSIDNDGSGEYFISTYDGAIYHLL